MQRGDSTGSCKLNRGDSRHGRDHELKQCLQDLSLLALGSLSCLCPQAGLAQMIPKIGPGK